MAVLWVKASAVIDNNYQIDKEMHKKSSLIDYSICHSNKMITYMIREHSSIILLTDKGGGSKSDSLMIWGCMMSDNTAHIQDLCKSTKY